MAEQVQETAGAERRKLLVRAAVVAGAVVCLLAGLLVYEQHQKSRASLPVPVSVPKPAAHVSAPLVSASPAAPSALPAEIDKALHEAPDVAQATLASMSGAHHEPAASAPASAPVEAKAGVPEASSVPARPAGRGADRVFVVDEASPVDMKPAAAKPVSAAAKPASARSAEPAHAKPEVQGVAPVAPATPNPAGFVVQLGVFNKRGNAEELRSKLALSGIPTTVETRVQLGPFKNREEALEAQKTLRSLGLNPGLLVPPPPPHKP